MPPEVSVVIPAYNEEKMIARAVSSVLACNFPSKEIIVVDDGSTDKTAEVVRSKFKGKNVRVVSAGRRGRAGALNLGIKESKGKYVLMTDADCEVGENWISEAVSALNKPEVGAVTGPHFFSDHSSLGQKMHLLLVLLLHNFLPIALQKLGFCPKVTGANMAFKKSLLREGFNETTQTDTLDISFKIAKQGKKIFFNPRMRVDLYEPPGTLSYFRKYKRWFGEVGRHLIGHRNVFRSGSSNKLAYLAVWLVFLGLPVFFMAWLAWGAYLLWLGQPFWMLLLAKVTLVAYALVVLFSIASILYFRIWKAILYLPLWLILLPTIDLLLFWSVVRAIYPKAYSGEYQPHRK